MLTNIKHTVSNVLKTISIPVAVYIFFYIASNGKFGSLNSLQIIATQTIAPTLISWGMCFNMVSGRLDLSVGSVMSLSAIIGTTLALHNNIGLAGFVIIIVISGLILGSISGAAYLVMRVPAMVTAIGVCMIYEMLTNVWNIGWNTAIPGKLTKIGSFPWNYIVFAVFFIICYLVYNHTVFGYNVRSIGDGQKVARNVGVKIKKNAFLCYVISGLFVGVAGVISISMAGSIATEQYMSSTSIIFGCMLGIYVATALSRYCNLVVGIIVGNFTMKMLASGLLAMGLKASLQNLASGLVILIVMIITSNQGKFANYMEMRKKKKSISSENAATM